ncbi:MAG: FprA family A-type flavoprotein [Verrucomicrobiota bacterium]|nr:FprA family A-type flavoprotein [Verrucomicrobiota bacterium]
MNSIEIQKNVFSTGYTDWDIRDFHGYTTKRGSSYNSYLIKDDKVALIDTVKEPYANNLLRNIKERVELTKVDYVVCNHAEPDHSGALPEVLKICKNATLICNAKCKSTLSMHYDTSSWTFEVVDEKTELSLGKNTLKFINTPMAHWPESMFTYIPEKKLLFSMDVFGQHYATSRPFDYKVDPEAIEELKTYYANIIMPYPTQVTKILEKVATFDIEMIAPSHGIIWKENISKIIQAYKDWAICKSEPKLLIFYDTMWKSTAMMANAIYEGAQKSGIMIKKFDLKNTNITIITEEIIDAATVAVGSPTLNKELMPKLAESLTYVRGLLPKENNKTALAFGSYGWGKKGAQHQVHEYLKSMGCKMLFEEPIQSQYVPTKEILDECRKAGEKLADIAKT